MDLVSEVRDGALLVQMPAVIDVTDYNQFESNLQKFLQIPCKLAVLDFSNTQSIKPTAHRMLNQFEIQFRRLGKRLFWLQMPGELRAQLLEDGHVVMVPTVSKIEFAVGHVRTSASGVDVAFVGPFISATKKTLEVQANIKIKQGKAQLRNAGDRLPVDLGGLIDLNSPSFKGSIALLFKQEVFNAIYESMLGEKVEGLTDEVKSAAGEILNIIYGNARKMLNEDRGYQLDTAIPHILVGSQLDRFRLGRAAAILIPFEGDFGKFHLEVFVNQV